ncbi:Putative SMARCAL1-like protein [Arachis hypogaea]|nr:Putative SMARCAL1-like protein [Arachis hypogaea]
MLQRNSNMTRLWMFSLSSLSEAEKVLGEISNYKVQLEAVKAKIKSAKSKDESESLKFTQKKLINKAGCKFLIFAHHQPMIDAIHKCLLKKKVGCIWIDGGTPAASRQQLVTDFQEKDYIKAAVLSIKAGGVGLTLTAASTVIFTEQSWTPGDLIQAKDRAYRIGQVLDGHENTLAVSNNQPLSSPAKHTTIGHRPSKQRTLDQFVRRCDNVDRSEVGTSA